MIQPKVTFLNCMTGRCLKRDHHDRRVDGGHQDADGRVGKSQPLVVIRIICRGGSDKTEYERCNPYGSPFSRALSEPGTNIGSMRGRLNRAYQKTFLVFLSIGILFRHRFTFSSQVFRRACRLALAHGAQEVFSQPKVLGDDWLSVRCGTLDGGIPSVGLLCLVELDSLAMTFHHSVNIRRVEVGAGLSLELREQRLVVRGKFRRRGDSDLRCNWRDLIFQPGVVGDHSLAEFPDAFASSLLQGEMPNLNLRVIDLHRRFDEVLVLLVLCECRGAKK